MPAGLLLEFEGVTQREYDAASHELGIDMKTGKGDWPAGLRSHTAGLSEDGCFMVTEVWDSQEHQAKFMEQRLGPALEKAGVPPPSRLVWIDVISHHQPA